MAFSCNMAVLGACVPAQLHTSRISHTTLNAKQERCSRLNTGTATSSGSRVSTAVSCPEVTIAIVRHAHNAYATFILSPPALRCTEIQQWRNHLWDNPLWLRNNNSELPQNQQRETPHASHQQSGVPVSAWLVWLLRRALRSGGWVCGLQALPPLKRQQQFGRCLLQRWDFLFV